MAKAFSPPRDLKEGMNHADDVKAMQRGLYDALKHYGLAGTNDRNGNYGDKTVADVAKLQRAVDWPSGQGGTAVSKSLAKQHVIPYMSEADATLWKGGSSSTQTIGEKALAKAIAELGVKDSPPNSNRGPRVDQYLAAVGLGGQAQPWCAAFVTWCYREAGRTLSGWNRAYCPAWVQTARANGGKGSHGIRQIAKADVRPGDVCLFDWQDDGTSDHVGIVEKAPGSGSTFTAIEGNTSTSDNSNGGEVMRRNRNVSDVHTWVRVD